MAQKDGAAKELGTLGSWDPAPSVISCKNKINSRTVEGERTGSGVIR